MPAIPRPPTNVVRQDIELLDNLKASGNVALYEEARAAVFDRHALELQPEIPQINTTLNPSLVSSFADKLHTTKLQQAILGQKGPPTELGIPPGSALGSTLEPSTYYYEGPQMATDFQPPIIDGMGLPEFPSRGAPIEPGITRPISALEHLISGDRAVRENYPVTRALGRDVFGNVAGLAPRLAEVAGGAMGWKGLEQGAKGIADRIDDHSDVRFGEPTTIASKDVGEEGALSPAWFAQNIAGFAGSLGLSLGGAKVVNLSTKGIKSPAIRTALQQAGFGSVAGGLESMGTYESLIKAGYSPEVAREAAKNMYLGSSILNAIGSSAFLNPSNRKILDRFVKGYFLEGTTEGLEEYVDAIGTSLATGDPADFNRTFKDFVNVFFQAGLTGGGFAAGRKQRFSRGQSQVLAEQQIKKTLNRFGFPSGKLNFAHNPVLDKEGNIQPGSFDPKSFTMNVHIPTFVDAFTDGSKSDIEAKAAELAMHEGGIHWNIENQKELLNAIYVANEDSIEQWIDQSEYANDNLLPHVKANEWIANNSEKDVHTVRQLELKVETAAEIFLRKILSKKAADKLFASTTARNLGQNIVNQTISIKDVQPSQPRVEPTLDTAEEVVTQAGPELTVTEEVGSVSPELSVLPEQITDPTLEDTSFEDLRAAREATQVQLTQVEEQLDSVIRDVTGEERFSKPPVDIDNRRQTAIAKAMAPNKHIRESDLRMNAIKENWEDNKNDLEFRRDYANFKEFEQAEWDLNYDMWIDEVQEAEAAETDTNVTQLEADPSIEELRAAREATQVQLTQLDEQLASLERDITGDTRFAKKASEMSETEKLNRDIRYDFARGPYKQILGRPDEAEIKARIKRLGNLYGPMGQTRGIEPGDRATAKEQAQNAIDNVDAFEEFMAPFEKQMKTQPARSKTAAGRQEKYAERKGITIAEILSYRDRGKIHPMERKMSYAFANEEIDRLEAEGAITAKEAEARRVKLREFQSELQGRMPPGAKRKVTEVVFGIGDYQNIEAWQFTEEETKAMEERAELAKAKERKTGTRRAVPTEQQAKTITAKKETTEETNILNDMEASIEENMIDYDVNTGEPKYTSWQKLVIGLKDRAGRLRWLREEEQVSTEERDMLDAFKKDPKTFDQETVQARRDVRQPVDETKVTRVKQTPVQRKAELKEMKEAQAPIEKRKHVQVEPDFFDSLVDTNFTMQGEAVPDGFMELTEEGEWSEVDDTDTRFAKAGEGTRMTAEARDYLINVPYFKLALDPNDKSDTPKIIKNDVGKIFWQYDKYGSIIPLEGKWGKGSMKEIEAAVNAIDFGTLELEAPMAITNSIHRFLDTRVSQSKGGYDAGVDVLRKVNEGLVAILRKIYLKKGIDKPGRALTFEHLRRKLGEKTVTKQYQSILGMMLGEADVIPSKSFTVTDFTKGMEKSWNIALVHPIPDKIKTAWQQGIDFQSKSERKGRFDADTPYTSALEFLQLGEKINQSKAAPKNDNEKHALAFYKKMTNDYGGDVVKKLDKYVTTMKTMRPASVAETVVKAALGWEGAGSIPSEFIQEIATLNKSLASIQTQNKDGVTESLAKIAADNMTRFAKRSKGDSYEEHFNKSFWYTLTSYLWGKPVQAIRDFNKLSRFGQAKADIPAADEIADEVQRAHSSTQRAESLVYGTDIVQDTSIMTGQFYTRLAQIFSRVTARLGDIEKTENQILVDVLAGKTRIEEIDNAETREAAKLLRELVQDVYDYAQKETKGLKKPLDLRGHGDTLLPRVWNIEFLATRRGKAKFLKAIRAAITDPATGSSILEDSELTVEDLYNVVVNSGGFVQGDWTNLKADQTRDQKEIDRDLRAQEYLDALPTESLIDEDLVMIDLQAIIPRFLQKAVERTEYSKRFGVNDEILREKIKEGLEQIKVHNAKVLKLDKTDTSLTYIDPRAFEKSIWDMMRILRNKYGYDMANMQTRAWLQRVVNFEVVAKLPLVTLASMPELFTPMLRGDVRADKWIVDLMMGLSWAGYKGMNGISKLLLNKHLPAMRKMSKDIGGIGVVSDMQLLRELGIAEIQAMGDSVSTRYANPNFARGGLRAGARTTIAGRIPKKVRAVFNMQTYMQATLLTTLTEMQQLMALRNFQRHMAKRVKFVQKNKDKELKGRRLRLFKQFSKDMADFGLPQNIDLSTPAGEAEFNAGAIRFVDQVITRPNDATTAKAFKNPLTAPIFLFKRFITTFGNTLMTAVGNDIATKVDNVEKAKQVGRIATTMVAMYGAVMFAEIMRAVIKGDLDEDDMTITGGDFRTFVRRVDRTGLLSAPGAMLLNLSFPYKRGWWDSPEARIWGELGGPIGGDLSALMKTGFDRRPGSAQRLIRQMIPMSKQLIDLPPKKKRSSTKKKTVLQQ